MPPDPKDPEKARVLSPDEVELLKKYRELLMPAARLAGYDEFAKWLFTVTAIIGTLGGAFSNAALKTLNGAGAIVFFFAVFFTGVSLALAVFERGIDTPDANWQSLSDMLAKAELALRRKRRLVWASGAFFGLAILLAGLAPLLSSTPISGNALSYSYGRDGVRVTANLVQRKDTVGDVRVSAILPSQETVIAAQRLISDSHGTMQFDVSSGVVPTGTTGIKISLTCDVAKGTKQDFTVPLQSKPDLVVSGTAGSSCLE